MAKSLPGSDEVGPVMEHHGADDLLPATVDAADGSERTHGSIDERRSEQVLQRTVVIVDWIDGIRQRHRPTRTEAVEERSGGVTGCGMMAS